MDTYPSPDDDVHILVGDVLSDEQQTLTTAHEAYGHAYVYDITNDFVQACHTYGNEFGEEWDPELETTVIVMRIGSSEIIRG